MTTKTAKTAAKKPEFYAFMQANDSAPTIRIGAAWKHGTGEGINIVLDATPHNGRVVLFPADAKKDAEAKD